MDLPAHDDNELAALRDNPPNLAPRVIGCRVNARSFQLLESHCRAHDISLPALIREALSAVTLREIEGPLIVTESEYD